MTMRVVAHRYEMLERVGDSPLFQVVRARDKLMNRMVAVKTLQPEAAADPELRTALEAATNEAARLVHPNIARVLDAGLDGDEPFVVTEFVRGMNLKERIRRIAPFTPWVVVDFGVAMLEAVHHAHSNSVLHGDLRPENVVVSPEGVVKVTDFSSARLLLSSSRAPAMILSRTAPYRSPEAAAGQPATAASDIYSAGVVLFEMLTATLPFPGETPLIMASRHANDPIPSPRTLNPGVPRALEGVVVRALQKRPADRYRSAADMLADLKQVRDGLRFGKSLSWSPMEAMEAGPAPMPQEVAPVEAPKAAAPRRPVVEAKPEPEPEPEPPAREVRPMPRELPADDRVSPFLVFLLKAIGVLATIAVLVTVAFVMAEMSKPKTTGMPNIIGMRIEQAREVAAQQRARLMEHEEYSDKHDAGIIWRIDPNLAGRSAAGRTVNVWVSKGSRMVWVPDVRNIAKEEAQERLAAAGLALGTVGRETSDKYPFDYVSAQNPRPGKRVKRDTLVNMIVSDGPRLGSETEPADMGPDFTGTGGGSMTDVSPRDRPTITRDAPTRKFPLEITVRRDGMGPRWVRVEYDDANGTHVPFNELHDEGDVLSEQVDVAGTRMTVRVYYGDPPRLRNERTFDLSEGGRD